MKREGKSKDFFISRTGTEADWAQWIAWVLEDAGYSCVVQDWDFRSGGNFVLDMHRGLQGAERVIAVLSQDYLDQSPFGQPEWAEAFRQDPTGEKGILVPIRVRPCAPEGLLGARTYLDLVGVDEKAAEQRLRDRIKEGRAKPATKPAFPGKHRPSFPGTAASLGHLPTRNPNFSGRKGLLAELRQKLTTGGPTALTQPQAVHGLGGVGKTQLAIEYAYRHAVDARDYDYVCWIRSEEPAQLASDYAALAVRLGVTSPEERDQPAMIEAARTWLESNGGWLLIFDNAPESTAVREFLPRAGGGHTLITSRNTQWHGTAAALRVEVFTPEESREFLRERLGAEGEEADDLRKELGDLPLALAQAVAYIQVSGSFLTDYLRLFRERRKELWEKHPAPEGYDKTTGTTWALSVEAAAKREPLALAALNLCAFFAPDDIPRSLLADAATRLEGDGKELSDELKLNYALSALHAVSLLTPGEGTVSLHRLVQAVTRDQLGPEGAKLYAAAACEAVSAAYPYDSDDVRTWKECEKLLPHALATAGHAEELAVALKACGHTLNQCGIYLQGSAQFSQAKEILKRALAISEQAYSPDHPEMAACLNNFGMLLKALGDLPGAKAHFKRALAIDEKIYSPDHPTVATGLNNLGLVLHELGDPAGAKANFERALAISEKVYGSYHLCVATCLNNLGSALRYLDDLPRAKANFERALAITEQICGTNHPNVAICLNNLGSVLQALGDLPGAKAHFKRALAIDEKIYSPDHPAVATDLNNLGGVLWALGDLPGAKAHFKRALAIDENFYGSDHPAVATDLNNLGGVLWDLGDLPGAKAHFERALAINRKFLEEEHPNTKLVRANLAALEG